MILKIDSSYNDKLKEYLKKEVDFNMFILGDIERYGYDNYFLDIWMEISNGNIRGVLLRYFEYLIFYSQGKFNVKEFSKLINNMGYSEISGKSEALEILKPYINVSKERRVKFCSLENNEQIFVEEKKYKIRKIKFGNISKIVKLYEMIDEFENTTIENIKNGLKTGRGYCIEIDKKVVAMAKSTLESDTHAMIVGVGTHPNYRNQGLATKCIIKICRELVEENKKPCLFYDNEEAGKIYRKIGFIEKGNWSIYYK